MDKNASVQNINNASTVPLHEYNQMDLLYDCFLGVLSLLIVVINVLVLCVFVHKPQIRTKTNCLLASLAASDLSMGLIGIPMYIGGVITDISWLYITASVLYRFIAVSTMFHIFAITVERYVFIIHPMKYVNVVKRRRLYGLIAFIWLFSLFIALIQLAWVDIHNYWAVTDAKITGGIIYHTFGATVCFICPFLIMAFIYGQMFAVIHRQVTSIRRQHIATESQNFSPIYAELRAISVFATMLAIFAFCWITWYISVFELYFHESLDLKISNQGYMAIDFFRFCTSFVNPLLYTYLKKDFRNAFKRMFKCRRRFFRNRSQATTQIFDTQYTTCTYEDTKC
ncbi:hypothetical protein QZH41_006417 [Actinostola sp. cb2023]|nr:hypothetical protein QZH41_006417 [Actinostola sp. cb2023]